MVRLTKRERNGTGVGISKKPLVDENHLTEYASMIITKLADYEDADENNRVIFLPCKPGDDVYCVLPDDNKVIQKCRVNGIEWFKHEELQYVIEPYNKEGIYYIYHNRDFGKTIFLTYGKAMLRYGCSIGGTQDNDV